MQTLTGSQVLFTVSGERGNGIDRLLLISGSACARSSGIPRVPREAGATLANSVKKSVAEVDGGGAKQLKMALEEAQASMGS